MTTIFSRTRPLALARRAALVSMWGLALAGAALADGGLPASVELPPVGNRLQSSALALTSLASLMASVNSALAHDTRCATANAAQASLCSLVRFSVAAAAAGSPAPAAMLDRCDLDGATPVCRIDLVQTLANGQRQALVQLDLAYAQGHWAPRGEAVVSGMRSEAGLVTALR